MRSIGSSHNIFAWKTYPGNEHNWYLLDRLQSGSFHQLNIGSSVIVDGHKYYLYDIWHGVSHNDFSAPDEINANGGFVVQVCEQSCQNSPLTMAFFK